MFVFAFVFVASLAVTTQTTVNKLAEVNADFAFRMYNQIKTNANVTDIFFSPISISTALGMLRLGAKGATLEQITTAMAFDVLGNNQNQLFKDLNAMLYNTSNNYTLRSANKVFASQRYTFQQAFLNGTRDYFGAEMQTLDFQGNPEAARTEINDWVEGQTENKIQDLMPEDSITSQTVMVLANAIYFKSLWTEEFDRQATSNLTFRDGQTELMVPMMSMSGKKFKYAESSSLRCQILELPYAGSVSMYILLPNETAGLNQLETQINVVSLNNLLTQMASVKVDVYIPRFELEDVKLNLVDHLNALGMTNMFTNSADLSGIGGNPGDLYVSSAVHKAYIKVDEEGTEAAAASGISLGRIATNRPPAVFRADHPFMFFIRENNSGTILFIGRLKKNPMSPPMSTRGPSSTDGTTALPTVQSGTRTIGQGTLLGLFSTIVTICLVATILATIK